jgi:hypothetical protein
VLIERHLSNYTERAPVGYWSLALALLLTLTVALVAVARHTRTAMRLPPALALPG